MKRLLLLIMPLCFSFNVISQNFTQLGLDINGIFNEDKSGHSVDMDSIGNRIIVGSPENDNNGFNSGNTSVLEWDGINWNQLGSIIFGEGQNQADGDQSGFSVSINAAGDIIAIGAPLAMSFSPNWGWVSSGHVRVFKWRVYTQADENNQLYHYSSYSQNSNQPKPLIITQNTSVSPVVGNHYWCQLGNDINGEYFGDEFGFSLDLNSSGNILAVGSKMGCSNLTGCSYIFQWDGSSWGQLGQTITGINYHDYFGSSISLNALGNRVVVGSPGSDDFSNGNLEDEKGISRVYDWNGFSWVQLGQDIFGESDNDHSGHSVAISSSGNIIAIGSPFAGSQMNCYQGHVRIFELLGSSWIQLGQTIEGDTCVDVCGWSVSLSSDGNTVIIGSPEHETSAGSYTGHSRVFNLVNSNWSQYGSNINGQVTLDFSGYSVALNSSGNRSIIGSPSYFNPGHTRVFENNGCNLGTNEICLVSVDSTSSKNLVVWEKPISESIDSFFVYRDVVGTYTKIGAVPYDSLSQFVDTTNGVNPNTTSFRYKLSVLDSCGIESVLSDFHETMHLTVSSAGGNDKNLIWDNYEGFSFVYYRIWRDDFGNGNWNVLDSVTSSNTTYTDITSPSPNSNYFIEVIPPGTCTSTKAVDHNSTRSNMSAILGGGSAPTSDFSSTSTQITAGTSIDFLDQSINNPTSWSWDFYGANPSTSSLQNPTNITYNNIGLYDVRLIVSNANGIDTLVKTNYIEVISSGGVAPTSEFIASDTQIQEGSSIDFLDQSQNNPTSWTWLFDGGSPSFSTNQSPTGVLYNTSGSYDVTLITSNSFGLDTLVKSAYINVSSSTSINDNGESKLTVHPNPTQDQITIDIKGYNGPVNVEVYDLQGRLLETTRTTTVSLRKYERGIYIFKVNYGEITEEVRVVRD